MRQSEKMPRSQPRRSELTLLYGLAMKLGIMPCLMPTLFARSLKRMALSAMRNASVYASAVSNTPGPVSVSESLLRFHMLFLHKMRTVTLDVDIESFGHVEDVVEVLLV